MSQLVDCRNTPQNAYKAAYCEEYVEPTTTTTTTVKTTTAAKPCGVYEVCAIDAAFNNVGGSAARPFQFYTVICIIFTFLL